MSAAELGCGCPVGLPERHQPRCGLVRSRVAPDVRAARAIAQALDTWSEFPADQLALLHAAQQVIEDRLPEVVAEARGIGMSWAQIAEQLGIERHTAFGRWRHVTAAGENGHSAAS